MLRRRTTLLYSLALLLIVAGTSCVTPRYGVEHVVLVWLKNPDDDAAVQKLVETSKSFEAIPGVTSVRIGKPIASPRQEVDADFDLGMSMSFDSRIALKRYLQHPIHKQAVENVLRPHVLRIRVHDFTHE